MLLLSENDGLFLLRVARLALEERIRLRPTLPLGEIPAAAERRAGAFVTLNEDGALRGCMGRVESLAPLYRTVQDCAVSAALADPRFEPVQPDEVPRLQIEVSVLSPLREVLPEQIELGRHGLLVTEGSFHGLLLPQVAAERNWDRNRFLEETCLKAGLARGAWKEGARIFAFSAEVFREPESEGRVASIWEIRSEDME